MATSYKTARKANECYLFNPKAFFRGHPPQSVITTEFCKNLGTALSYDKFCVYDPKNDDYQFLDWDDPLAQRIWHPYVSEKRHVEITSLFDDEEANENIATPATKALFEYQAMEEDAATSSFGSDHMDPISSMQHLVSNQFFENFSAQLDAVTWDFLTTQQPQSATAPPSEDKFERYSIDVASTLLQLLGKRPDSQPKQIFKETSLLTKQINDNLPANQRFKHRLLFLNQLGFHSKVASEMFKQAKPLSTALNLLDKTKAIIHQDDHDFEKFINIHFPSSRALVGSILDKWKINQLDHAHLRRFLESTSQLSYETFIRGRQNSPTFSVHSESSNIASWGIATRSKKKVQQQEDFIYEQDFLDAVTAIVAFGLFIYPDLQPSDHVSKLFGFKRTGPFIRLFREKYKLVFFEESFVDLIEKAIDDFLEVWLSLSIGEIDITPPTPEESESEEDDFVDLSTS